MIIDDGGIRMSEEDYEEREYEYYCEVCNDYYHTNREGAACPHH